MSELDRGRAEERNIILLMCDIRVYTYIYISGCRIDLPEGRIPARVYVFTATFDLYRPNKCYYIFVVVFVLFGHIICV